MEPTINPTWTNKWSQNWSNNYSKIYSKWTQQWTQHWPKNGAKINPNIATNWTKNEANIKPEINNKMTNTIKWSKTYTNMDPTWIQKPAKIWRKKTEKRHPKIDAEIWCRKKGRPDVESIDGWHPGAPFLDRPGGKGGEGIWLYRIFRMTLII